MIQDLKVVLTLRPASVPVLRILIIGCNPVLVPQVSRASRLTPLALEAELLPEKGGQKPVNKRDRTVLSLYELIVPCACPFVRPP